MDTSKVSSKWQVVIPRSVRQAEQIRVGSEVAFERTEEGILLRPVGGRKAHGAGGSLRHPQDTASGGEGSGYRACSAAGGRA